ncbi:MAG TPA: glycosyltransferase [Terriglobales bacterium]|jgi:glycosyltransferase involved in cell wall biosynthesis|nr:glycosyltransferase [Terriglobales bacterium]
MDVSIVISTYNRCGLLEGALGALLSQTPADAAYEILVVDNNSTDQTRSVVQGLAMQNQEKLKYLFEPKQGLSYGRNAGIAAAKAPIIAFTDDDVRVAADWVWRVKGSFEANPDIDFLGGKVVPRWPAEPPPWLTKENWSPLALLDYGERPFYVDSGNQLCLIGANFAFRRRAFDKVGLFKTDFQRVKDGIGSLEDHEILLRLWRAGSKGLYLPELVATAEIEPDRMEKQYHRRWHSSHGRFYAALHSEEVERSKVGKLFGVPAHFYRQALNDFAGWIRARARHQPAEAFTRELGLRYFTGFAGRRWREFFGFGPK